ncbi:MULTISPECIES: hypothetical protein [Paenibacillus]|nr:MULTISPECIES: hypothetical protein [Paenibacillus]
MNATIKRPISPAESLKQSLIEMKQIRSGKAKGKSWRELREELKRDQ